MNAAATKKKIATPPTNPEVQPYWDAANQSKLLYGHCDGCGKAHFYPRVICPFCMSDKTEMKPAAGTGTLYSYSVMRRSEVPYAIAYVTLDEGPTMMTNIVDMDFDAIKIGMKMKVVFDTAEGGGKVPMFTAA